MKRTLGRKSYWLYSYGPDEMRGRVETPAGKQRVTTGFFFFAQEKDIAALAASICTQPGHSVHGTCLHMFCFLGNGILTYRVICTDEVVCFDC